MRRFYVLFTLSLMALGVLVMLVFNTSSVYAGDLAPNPTPVPVVDTDGDGLPDTDDQCPTVAGIRENRGCPGRVNPVDTDGDGLPDTDDQCPTVAGTRENRGCPVTDVTTMPPPPPPPSVNPNPTPDPTATTIPPAVFTPPALPSDGCYVTSPTDNNVNVRQDPEANAPIIGQLFPSKVYNALGYIEKEGEFWFALTNYEGTTGTIGFASASVLMRSDCNQIAMASQNNLKQIGLALHNYADTTLFEPFIDSLLAAVCDGRVRVYYELKDVLVTSYQSGSHNIAGDDPCAEIPTAEATSEPTGGGKPMETFTLNWEEIKIQIVPEGGVNFNLREVKIGDTNTNDDGSTTLEYCINVELYEVGVFNVVCYQIEVPANCTVVSTEAGVYTVVCEGEGTISLNPDLDGLPALDLTILPNSESILIGLLLPAVQS